MMNNSKKKLDTIKPNDKPPELDENEVYKQVAIEYAFTNDLSSKQIDPDTKFVR